MPAQTLTPFESARSKVYRRLIPLVFVSYVIAYIDRANVSLAKLDMAQDLKFDNEVFGIGAGIFFIGYFLLEIPGTLIVERWSARKWISRIMITWGIMAGLTAWVKTPGQFYGVRFLLGLAEAGFFPGVIVYLSHWFTSRDRARALAYFFIAAPVAQIISPVLSAPILRIGREEMVNGQMVYRPELLGMEGWQWMYIVWALPAVIMGVIVLFALTDRPAEARWLTPAEREALQAELDRDRAQHGGPRHMSVLSALAQPRVLLLALVFFLVVTANYGVEFFLPSILERWHGLKRDTIAYLVWIPYVGLLAGQLFVSWSSDRTGERWLHASIPILLGAVAMSLAPTTQGSVVATLLIFALIMAGIRGYMPAFWALPSSFLKGAAAAGSVGFINSVGNLGGYLGPYVLGRVEKVTGSFVGGIYFLAGCIAAAGAILLLAGLSQRRARTAA